LISTSFSPVSLVSTIKVRADFLITGDKKRVGKAKIRKAIICTIMNPSEFLEELAVILTSTD